MGFRAFYYYGLHLYDHAMSCRKDLKVHKGQSWLCRLIWDNWPGNSQDSNISKRAAIWTDVGVVQSQARLREYQETDAHSLDHYKMEQTIKAIGLLIEING